MKNTQTKLVQSEKMASLGTLTAGVAHEINNPTNFVHISAFNLEEDLKRFQQFLLEPAPAPTKPIDSGRCQFSTQFGWDTDLLHSLQLEHNISTLLQRFDTRFPTTILLAQTSGAKPSYKVLKYKKQSEQENKKLIFTEKKT